LLRLRIGGAVLLLPVCAVIAQGGRTVPFRLASQLTVTETFNVVLCLPNSIGRYPFAEA